jgi:HAE1 family hydrophobic/amphiphilic exporter-1
MMPFLSAGVAVTTLPQGYTILAGKAFRWKRNAVIGDIIFAVACFFVYMVLAAQCRDFLLPLAVILSLPAGVFGTFITEGFGFSQRHLCIT